MILILWEICNNLIKLAREEPTQVSPRRKLKLLQKKSHIVHMFISFGIMLQFHVLISMNN